MHTNRNAVLSSLVCVALAAFPALASSHREAPSIALDPAADNTDLYAWVKPGAHDKLYILANYIPLEEPSGGPNFHTFSDEVLYEVHIARGNQSLEDVVTYQIRFKTDPVTKVDEGDLTLAPGGGKEFFLQLAARAGGGFPTQRYTVTKIENGKSKVIAKDVKVAPPNVGPRTFALVTKAQYGSRENDYNDAFAASFITPMGENGSEGRVFAGPRDDGFYVDLGGIFDLAGLRPPGMAQDGVAGFNTHTIALEIPTTKLTADGLPPGNTPSVATTLGIWASASRRQGTIRRHNGNDDAFGPWVQVSRLGLPLVNEVLIGLQDKDRWNHSHPSNDVERFGDYFLNPILVRDAELAGFYAPGGPLAGIAPPRSNRLDIIDLINLKDIPTPNAHSIPLSATGDVLRVDMATDSAFPNGRPILGGTKTEQADVTDVLLSLILTKLAVPVSDGVNANDKTFLTEFPFLALPWRGSDEGHGSTAP